MKTKKILCVHQGYELYGSDRSFILSVSILRELYPDTVIDVMIPKDGPIRQLVDPAQFNLIINEELAILRKKELKRNPFKLFYKTIKGIFSAIRLSKEYDLVYVNTVVVLDYIVAARFMKCPTILHIREIPTGVQGTVFSKIIAFSRMYLFFNSQNTQDAFTLPASQHKTVILNGVKGFTDILPKEYPVSPLHILLIGRLTEWKGQMFFLQALAQLMKQKRYELNVRIVGEVFEDQVAYKYALQDFVKDHDLADIVEFKSFTDDPGAEYAWSDIIIVPSVKPEPFGRVAIEAMSASRCVVAADHGGLSEIIESGKDGILFRPGDTGDLSAALQKLIESQELIAVYAQEGLKKFEHRFSDTVYREKFMLEISHAVK